MAAKKYRGTIFDLKTRNEKEHDEYKDRLNKVKSELGFESNKDLFEYLLSCAEKQTFAQTTNITRRKRNIIPAIDRVNAFVNILLAYNNSNEVKETQDYLNINTGLTMRELGVNSKAVYTVLDDRAKEIEGQKESLNLSVNVNNRYRLLKTKEGRTSYYPQTEEKQLQFIAELLKSWEVKNDKVGYFGRDWSNEKYCTDFK